MLLLNLKGGYDDFSYPKRLVDIFETLENLETNNSSKNTS